MLVPGTLLGHFRIIKHLKSGGMGDVYSAQDTDLPRRVAVKVLPPEFAKDEDRRRRFEEEARTIAQLEHPNIVRLIDIVKGDPVCLVTELVEGTTLRPNPSRIRHMLEIAAQIAKGLAAAHAAGITHRDLKPSNVMVTYGGLVKILDFGLAKTSLPSGTDDSSATPTEDTGAGTVGYMSPEQIGWKDQQGRRIPVGPLSDIFSFGILLYELFSGKRPFQGATGVDVMHATLHAEPHELPGSLPTIKRLFTVPEAAEYLGRSENAIKILIHRGKLPVTRIDSKSQIDKRALDKLIDQCTYFESEHRT